MNLATAARPGSGADPVWRASQRAAALALRSAWPGAAANRLARVRHALERVVPGAGPRFDEALRGVSERTRPAVQRAAAVALAHALLDRYLELGKRVWESRSDPRLINPLAKAGLDGLGNDADLREAEKVMVDVACHPATLATVSGIVGAVTYGIGGALVGTGGAVAQQQACPRAPAPATPTPAPPPAAAAPVTTGSSASTLPAWVIPTAIAGGVTLLGLLVYYGASH